MSNAGSIDQANTGKRAGPTSTTAPPTFSLDDIRDAIAADQFYLLAQAQVNLETFELIGFECLARWSHPQFGEIPPFRFIPLLEEAQQCHLLTLHLFDRMLRIVEALEEISEGLHFSLNISANDLSREDFAEQVIKIARQHKLNYNSIVLEVTETAGIFGDTSVVNLRKLKAFGVQLAVDDFWTGFSTLETIRLNLFSEVKIDFSLTSQLLTDKTSMAGTNSILQLSSNLGLRCIVEGIENSITRSVLLEAGASYGQGFLFSRGVKDSHLKGWIQKYQADIARNLCNNAQLLLSQEEKEQLETRQHPSWVWDFDTQGITWANSSALFFWRVESEEELTKRDFSSMSYIVKTRLESYRRRLLSGEEVITSEWDFFPSGESQKVFCIQVPRIDPESGKMIMLVNAFEGFHSRLPQRKYIESSNEFPVPFMVVDEDGKLLRINKHAHIEIDFLSERITDLISDQDFNKIKSSCADRHLLETFADYKQAESHETFYIRALMLPDKNHNGRNIFHIVAIPVSKTLSRGMPGIER